mgnify:FL=1
MQDVVDAIRHCAVLNVTVESIADTEITLKLPYSEKLVGNPGSGVVHGGVLTTLLDTACGMSVPVGLGEFLLCPTLDLRIDHMSTAQPEAAIYARAAVYRLTDNIIFSRGAAYQNNKQRPIAYCVATFMRLPKNVGSINPTDKFNA